MRYNMKAGKGRRMVGLFRVRWLQMLVLFWLAACAPLRPGEARIPDDAWISHRAVLIGKSDHDTVGTISLYQSDDYPVVVFEPNFRMSGAPGTVVALGTDGYRPESALGALLRPSGRQAYAVPRAFDVGEFNEVWLWDSGAGRPVGIARLTPL
jgi:hypothetical protein